MFYLITGISCLIAFTKLCHQTCASCTCKWLSQKCFQPFLCSDTIYNNENIFECRNPSTLAERQSLLLQVNFSCNRFNLNDLCYCHCVHILHFVTEIKHTHTHTKKIWLRKAIWVSSLFHGLILCTWSPFQKVMREKRKLFKKDCDHCSLHLIM